MCRNVADRRTHVEGERLDQSAAQPWLTAVRARRDVPSHRAQANYNLKRVQSDSEFRECGCALPRPGIFANLSDAFAQLPSKPDVVKNKPAKTVRFL
jgi:hypothetical protein